MRLHRRYPRERFYRVREQHVSLKSALKAYTRLSRGCSARRYVPVKP
jgi:hypothetical protein